MPFIAFLGCDGSGKSAVIQGLKVRLEEKGHLVTLGHWRPKPFAKVNSDASTADDPHGHTSRGIAASLLKLGWLWANWWMGWFSGIRQASGSGYVLFDRYHKDLIIDPKRYRYGGPIWIARWASRLMPQPDQILFLDAAPDILLSRKQEVSYESLEHSRASYLDLALTATRFRVVDASRPLADVIEDVFSHLPGVD